MINPLSLGFKSEQDAIAYAVQIGKAADVQAFQLAPFQFQVVVNEDTQNPPSGRRIFSNF